MLEKPSSSSSEIPPPEATVGSDVGELQQSPADTKCHQERLRRRVKPPVSNNDDNIDDDYYYYDMIV